MRSAITLLLVSLALACEFPSAGRAPGQKVPEKKRPAPVVEPGAQAPAEAPGPAPARAKGVEMPAAELDAEGLPIRGAPARGGAAPLVTVVYFSDIQCPFCNEARSSLAALEAKYGDQLRIVWRNLPLESLHPNAFPAAVAAMAAGRQGPEIFWAANDALFAHVAEYSGRNAPQLVPEGFERFFVGVPGLDLARWREDVAKPELAKAVRDDIELAMRVEAGATPTFFINGKKVEGMLPPEMFSKLIDKEIEAAKKLLAAGTPQEGLYAARTKANLITADTRFKVEPAGPGVGRADAKITIVTFTDYQCPFCAAGEETIKQLVAKYPGEIRVVYRAFPLAEIHPDATLAAQAALAAAEQGKFSEYHEKLFANQRVPDPARQGKEKSGLTRPDLERYAAELGLDMPRFKAALDDRRFAAQVQADVDAATALGVSGTPAFFVNGKAVRGAYPLEYFDLLAQAELKAADALLAAGVPRENLYRELTKDGFAVVP